MCLAENDNISTRFDKAIAGGAEQNATILTFSNFPLICSHLQSKYEQNFLSTL